MQHFMVAVVMVAATYATSVSPAAAQATAGEPTYVTRNGPRTASQLSSELTSAGYGGPWDTPSQLAAYERAGPPSIPPYQDDTTWSCLPTNPSCSRDPWWAERTAREDPPTVTFAAIGPSFTAQRSFVEAVNLLWQSPEGKALLRQGDRAGVAVIALDYDRQEA